ncbi:MAG: hypothetical protein HXM02_10980, partial [[Eubacterium] sulci]|nr:hypothetical protein [[Eubacterium] sulci]
MGIKIETNMLWQLLSNISMKDKDMQTIKDFLDNDIYLDIIKELGVDNFNQDVQSVEVEELKNRL